ncbi:hypothetical protein [Hymenobacter antarcticus]|uniref:Gliding motility-associated C-terminal domain-containing protein n=1 Tax=Hymenobacter antarcticus TaxID=486270 RepID=A0ABP7QMG3_9BACT
MEHYSIPKSSFSNFLWINDGALFDNVTLIEIEMTNGGAFRLEMLDKNDKILSKGSRENPRGGWHTFTPSQMQPPVQSGPYKLKLVSEAPGIRKIHGGNVHY